MCFVHLRKCWQLQRNSKQNVFTKDWFSNITKACNFSCYQCTLRLTWMEYICLARITWIPSDYAERWRSITTALFDKHLQLWYNHHTHANTPLFWILNGVPLPYLSWPDHCHEEVDCGFPPEGVYTQDISIHTQTIVRLSNTYHSHTFYTFHIPFMTYYILVVFYGCFILSLLGATWLHFGIKMLLEEGIVIAGIAYPSLPHGVANFTQ